MQRLLFLLIILTFFSFPIAAQYYVAPSGDDANQGTISSPFKTIQKAADILKAGDSCFIRQGIYRETITPKNNGKPDKPIVFKAYQQEIVQITGCEPITNWEKHEGNIYKSYIADTVYQLMMNNQLAFEARYPDKNQEKLFSLEDWIKIKADSTGRTFYEKMNSEKDHWKGAICVILSGKNWVTQMGIVESSDSNAVYCSKRSDNWTAKGFANYLGEGIGYLINHMNALDNENEWLWQNDTLYYYTSGNIIDLQTEARTRNLAFNCEGKSYIHLSNLHFTNASLSFNNATNCSFDRGSIIYPSPLFHFYHSFNRKMLGKNDTLNFSIDHWEGKGLILSGENNIISSAYIANSWGDGISVGGQNNKVFNCLIENCNLAGMNAAAIAITGKGHQLTHNTIRNTGRSGIVHYEAQQIQIMYNDISFFGQLTQDLGGTYVYNTDGKNSEIAYNWIHDAKTRNMCEGVYIDNYCSNFKIHHNVIWHVETGIRTNKPANNLSIYHNTIWLCRYIQKTTGGIQFKNNTNQQVFNNLSSHPFHDGTFLKNNLSIARPGFTNIHVFDFSLKTDSEAIDYGIIIQGLTKTFEGLAPDAGAYEYGLPVWKAGVTF